MVCKDFFTGGTNEKMAYGRYYRQGEQSAEKGGLRSGKPDFPQRRQLLGGDSEEAFAARLLQIFFNFNVPQEAVLSVNVMYSS